MKYEENKWGHLIPRDDAISTPQEKLLRHFQARWDDDFWYETSKFCAAGLMFGLVGLSQDFEKSVWGGGVEEGNPKFFLHILSS